MTVESGTSLFYFGKQVIPSSESIKRNNRYKFTNISDEDCPHKASGLSDMGYNEVNLTTSAANSVQIKPNKKQTMLANPDCRRFYLNMSKTSQGNADVSLRRLSKFCEDNAITPMQFIELAQKDIKAATDLLADHIQAMEDQGKAPNYQKKMLDSLKSWMEHFGLKPSRKIKIRNISSTPTLEDERVPEGSELAEIFNRCSLRTGATVSFLSKAGLRPEVLGKDGSDGLLMKDLPDIALVQGVAICMQSPPMVIVRRTLSKAGHQYFSFLTSQATKKLIAYLNDRLARGEVLDADSPVIAPDHRHKYGTRYPLKKFLKSARISHMVREDALRPRFEWRPYVLRAFFDTQMLIAESKGKVAHDFRVFWMGHKGSIEAIYTTNKARLPEALLKEMREAFQRCEEFLDLEVREEDPMLKQKDKLHQEIEKATPDKVQKILRLLESANPPSDGGSK